MFADTFGGRDNHHSDGNAFLHVSSVPSFHRRLLFDQIWMTVPFLQIPAIVAAFKAISPLFVLQTKRSLRQPIVGWEGVLCYGSTPSPVVRRLDTLEVLLPGPREGHPLRAGHC